MGMRNVRMWLTLIGLSIFALAILDFFPGGWVTDAHYIDAIVSYALVATIFYCGIYLLGLPTLQYFGFKRMRIKGVIAALLAIWASLYQIIDEGLIYKTKLDLIGGTLFLLILGLGEEFLSRGFVYGVLLKYGQLRAIFFSSLFFGLMHINVYLPNEIGWDTYYHVFSTFGFGIIMCALMIVTKSIWVPVLCHALTDWHIPFTKHSALEDDGSVYTLWDNLTGPFLTLLFDLLFALFLLAMNRYSISNTPRWVKRLAIKWKLVHPPADKFALVGEN
jgi:membrane protease YdiL (CAAX protease family)